MKLCEAEPVLLDGITPFKDRFLLMTVKPSDSAERSYNFPAILSSESCHSPFSRSTRCSLAYNCSFTQNPETHRKKSKHGGVIFMEDFWREELSHTRPEAEIYNIFGDEACFQPSVSLLGDRTCFSPHNPLQCHRIFLDTMTRDLSAFGNCKVLVDCMADAMEGMRCAFAYGGIMHRDISSRNIRITPAHRGLLHDWDLCLVSDSKGLIHPRRMGPWQFMSLNLLQGGVHSLDDDKESAFWVLVHIALRYLKHSLEPTELHQKLFRLFDCKTLDKFGREKGGLFKRTELPACAYDSRELATFEVPGFNDLLTELAGVLLVRYRQPTVEAVQRYEARLARGGEVDQDNPVAIYKAKLERLADPNWFHETLRRHAKNIPLPTQPSSARRAGALTVLEGSLPVPVCDFHENAFYSEEEEELEDLLLTVPQKLEGIAARRTFITSQHRR